jgi:hypothetical protein
MIVTRSIDVLPIKQLNPLDCLLTCILDTLTADGTELVVVFFLIILIKLCKQLKVLRIMTEDGRPILKHEKFIEELLYEAGILDLPDKELEVDLDLANSVRQNVLIYIELVNTIEFLEEGTLA